MTFWLLASFLVFGTTVRRPLNERFDNPRLIMNSHMDGLFNFSPLRLSSLENLKHFLGTFLKNIAAFRSFDIPDKEGFLLFYIASRVLDSTAKCLFESQHTNTILPNIDNLLKYVQTRVKFFRTVRVPPHWYLPRPISTIYHCVDYPCIFNQLLYCQNFLKNMFISN